MAQTLWITGAGSGIGAAMARVFARAGYQLALTARNRQALEAVVAELPKGPHMIAPDREGMAQLAREIAQRTGGLHVLCNNAGLNIPKRRWSELDWPSWDLVLRVNLTGAINVIAACLPVMRAQADGVMVHTSSWAGRFHSDASGVPYGASKHALSELSASLNGEEGANGIRSCALCPAEVATPLMSRRPGYDPASAAEMIRPEDVAQAALFVARMNPIVAVHEIVLAPIRR